LKVTPALSCRSQPKLTEPGGNVLRRLFEPLGSIAPPAQIIGSQETNVLKEGASLQKVDRGGATPRSGQTGEGKANGGEWQDRLPSRDARTQKTEKTFSHA
jgi:hypothetical protein